MIDNIIELGGLLVNKIISLGWELRRRWFKLCKEEQHPIHFGRLGALDVQLQVFYGSSGEEVEQGM